MEQRSLANQAEIRSKQTALLESQHREALCDALASIGDAIQFPGISRSVIKDAMGHLRKALAAAEILDPPEMSREERIADNEEFERRIRAQWDAEDIDHFLDAPTHGQADRVRP